MWNDDHPGAAEDFKRRVAQGDTEFPVDLLQGVVGYVEKIEDSYGKATRSHKADKVLDSWVVESNVDAVKDWVGDDPARAKAALKIEKANAKRVSLVSYLENVAG